MIPDATFAFRKPCAALRVLGSRDPCRPPLIRPQTARIKFCLCVIRIKFETKL